MGSHSLPRRSSKPRFWIQVSHIAGRFFTIWATGETLKKCRNTVRIAKTWYRPKVTKCCYKNGANRLAQHRVVTNLPLKKKKRYLQSGIKQGTPVLRATGVSKCRKYCQALFRLFSLLNKSWFSPPCERSHLFKKTFFFYLFGCAGSYLVAHGIYSHGLWIRSCSMWGLVPWLGIEPRLPALGTQNLSHWTTREVTAATFQHQK